MTSVFTRDLDVPLEGLIADADLAVRGWDWRRGAYGHALSLPNYRNLHPYARYSYQNFPCTGLLAHCPHFRAVFDRLACEKVSFRLLRREGQSAYRWHTDEWKGPGVVRFQIPIRSDESSFLITTSYEGTREIQGDGAVLTPEQFERFAAANAGRFERHTLVPGRVHYFNTTRVHTLVNMGAGERITLSFDLVANDWLLDFCPAIRAELGDGSIARLPVPGPAATALAFAKSRVYPLRGRARLWREHRRSAEHP